MNVEDPVGQLDKIFVDNLGDDWDLSGNPEEVILGVPEGTVASLLRKIADGKLWPSLYEAAERHSDQWMLDLSEFFPLEEAFVEPLVRFLLLVKSQHAKVCFALEAVGWAWGQGTKHLLPVVKERVREIRNEVKGGGNELVGTSLDNVIIRLGELEAQQKINRV